MRNYQLWVLLMFLLLNACEPGPSISKTERAFTSSDRLKESIIKFENSRQNSREGLYKAYAQIDTIIDEYGLENARMLTGKFEQIWNENVMDRVIILGAVTRGEKLESTYIVGD